MDRNVVPGSLDDALVQAGRVNASHSVHKPRGTVQMREKCGLEWKSLFQECPINDHWVLPQPPHHLNSDQMTLRIPWIPHVS